MKTKDKSLTCPYGSLPETAFWRRAVSALPPAQVNPAGSGPFILTKQHRIATAGSCFAQHIAHYLGRSGYLFWQTEPTPELLGEELGREFGYGLFSARYGNIYTSRQLRQLLLQAYGRFPREEIWRAGERWIDPLRPFIQPEGFASETELRADREQHLAAVRHLFETLDVFVFTLGLTETWLSRTDGTAYPVCPGCGAGVFSEAKYMFHNLTCEEVVEDLREFVRELRAVNPQARVILTVSPVPLVATMAQTHVLLATTYSKAVLRVAAETLARAEEAVTYFPAFEIITGSFNRGAYFGENLRDVRPEGVEHVMRCFFECFAQDSSALAATPAPAAAEGESRARTLGGQVVDVICDEGQLDVER